MTQTTPAGWYDDGSGRLRYWDGEAWTDHFQDDQAVTTKVDHKAAASEAKAAQKAAADEAKAMAKAASDQAKTERKAATEKARSEKEAQKRADLAAFNKRAGRLVIKGNFGAQTVEIYENGFARVGLFLRASSPLEELRTITFRRASRDKGSGGRAMGALATGGLNLLASKEKVQAFLSIATSTKVHQLSSSQASASEEKMGMALEAAGQSVLDLRRNVAPTVAHQLASPAAVPKSVADQIRELAALHADGILSDEEFATTKASLLSQM